MVPDTAPQAAHFERFWPVCVRFHKTNALAESLIPIREPKLQNESLIQLGIMSYLVVAELETYTPGMSSPGLPPKAINWNAL